MNTNVMHPIRFFVAEAVRLSTIVEIYSGWQFAAEGGRHSHGRRDPCRYGLAGSRIQIPSWPREAGNLRSWRIHVTFV
jgi:hypothetical protein